MFEQLIRNPILESVIPEERTSASAQIPFIEKMVSDFEASPKRQFMDTAQRYYENENVSISDAHRMVISRDPETNQSIMVESKVLTNNKIHHNFMKKLTRQKISYMLGKPFSLTKIKQSDDAQCEEFFDLLYNYFNSSFLKTLKNVGRDSIVKGIGWLYVYYDESGNLKFKRIPSEEIIPIWNDNDHTELNGIIRNYKIREFRDGDMVDVGYIDYYTTLGEFHYKYNPAGILEPTLDAVSSNFKVGPTIEQAKGVVWNKLPFIAFKYDPDEQSLLSRIKDLIDDYDRKVSAISNDVDDHPNSLLVVKNYDGNSKEEFTHNKNQYRALFVQGDGGVDSLETPLDIKDIDIHLQRLREDIFEFGQGVNTADKDIRDTSGVALRFLYADLDMDCADWGGEVKSALETVIWFIVQDLKVKAKKDFSDCKYDIIFNTDVIINETETITNCFTSQGIISAETIAANHPWTLDAKTEVADKLKDEENSLSLESEYGNKSTSNNE